MLSSAIFGVWVGLAALAATPALAVPPEGGFPAARASLDAGFRSRLDGLKGKCLSLGLAAQADATARWGAARDPRRQYLFLPLESDPAKPPDDAPKIVQQWYARFSEIRRQQAGALFELAQAELKVDRPTRAYQLLHEVLHDDPDHAQARAILGYRQVNGVWRKPEGVTTARTLRVPHPAFGNAVREYWVIESGHFSVTTSLSEAAGRELIAQLEDLYAVWQQVFFPFWSNGPALARRFEGQIASYRSLKRHKVVLFRDREQYVRSLQEFEPQIDKTIGYYLESSRTAYFYGGDDASVATRFHEVTHQLFSENSPPLPSVGGNANAWVLEGVALYMESLQRRPGVCTLGGIDADRLQYARYRARNERAYTPLEQLVALGRKGLQEHPEIRRLYSQCAGLAAFLMDYRQGVYREALTQYLHLLYQGRGDQRSLASLTGVALAELDRQYRDFLDVTDEHLAYLASQPTATRLSLGRTSVTDAGLKHLAGHTQLEWLDLAYTATTDAGLAHLQSAANLKHLIAEHTGLTDAALATISRFERLEILDLTDTRITDAGLAHLARLARLTELWIGNTPVTDEGLKHLHGLKNLKTLDVNGAKVTADGWQQLKTALPSLETEHR